MGDIKDVQLKAVKDVVNVNANLVEQPSVGGKKNYIFYKWKGQDARAK